jgi:type II secretory pathway pseudopilin PulG
MNYLTKFRNKNNLNQAYTLIEILISIFFISLISIFAINAFLNFFKLTLTNRLNLQILSALENELEIIRVLNYEDIGTINGWPRGILQSPKIINNNGLEIKISYYIRNIDDPADGVINGNPNDLAPADYKLVELEGECLNCPVKTSKQKITTIVAPKNVESSTRNGSLYIKVINAQGEPVSEAQVKVVNNSLSPPLIIEDLTNNMGLLQLIDIPTGTNVYEINVTKDGYSSDRTYPLNLPDNPNPLLPHQTVLEQTLTNVTFQIDLLSNLFIKTIDNFCQPISNVPLKLSGIKLIGRNPDIIKNIINNSTDNNGEKLLKLEWDNYNYQLTTENYVMSGYNLTSPFNVLPNNNYYLRLNLVPLINKSLLVTVLDNQNNPLNEAEVKLTRTNFEKILKTKIEIFSEENWINNYYQISNYLNVDENGLSLKKIGNIYPTNTDEWLISNTIDLGTSSNVKLLNLRWLPEQQPDNTEVKFQIALNNDNNTWNFVGPDGTSNSYFTLSPSSLLALPVNKRYLRYKIYLKTYDENYTPSITKIFFEFTSDCLANGQILFNDLNQGEYNLLVNKSGFRSTSTTINIQSSFQEIKINLIPE